MDVPLGHLGHDAQNLLFFLLLGGQGPHSYTAAPTNALTLRNDDWEEWIRALLFD